MPPDQVLLDDLKAAHLADENALARHLCEVVLERWPDHAPTLVRYASSLTALALYDEAAAAIERAMAVVPAERRAIVYAQKGHLLEYTGDFEGAEKMHLQAHRLDPDDAVHLIYAGCVASRRGDHRRAETLHRQALTCSEGLHEEAHFNLGGIMLVQKKYREARTCYLKALELDDEYEEARERLDEAERLLGCARGKDAM